MVSYSYINLRKGLSIYIEKKPVLCASWNLFRRSFYIFFTFEWEHARTCYQWVNIHVFLFSAIYCWFCIQHLLESHFLNLDFYLVWRLVLFFKAGPPCSMLVEVWGDWASSAVVWMVLWRPTRHYCVSVLLMISFLNGGHWSFPAWLSICFLHFCHYCFMYLGTLLWTAIMLMT